MKTVFYGYPSVVSDLVGNPKENFYYNTFYIFCRLRGYLENQSTCRLHQMLGDFLTQIGDHLEALDQYSKALG